MPVVVENANLLLNEYEEEGDGSSGALKGKGT